MSSRARVWALILVGLVTGLSLASRAGLVSPGTLAASPRRLAEGKVWLLVSNGLVVQRPAVLGVLSFAALGAIALAFCGARVFVVAALAGHVGSTLVVYALVGLLAVVDQGAVRAVLGAPDYGVSAIQAAWLGAIAAVVWRWPGRTGWGRFVVVLACFGVGLFAWSLRGSVTILDSDHLFAFVIGAWTLFALGRGLPQSLPTRQGVRFDRISRMASRLGLPPGEAAWPPLLAALLVLVALSALLLSVGLSRAALTGSLAAIPVGVLLFGWTRALGRRSEQAWQLALIVLVVLSALALGERRPPGGVLLAVVVAFLLWSRPAFSVRSAAADARSALRRAVLVVGGTALVAAVFESLATPGAGLSALVRETMALLLWEPGPVAFSGGLRLLPLAVNVLSLAGLFFACSLLFRPRPLALDAASGEERRIVAGLVRAHGRDTLAFFKLRRDLHYLFSPDRRACLGYRCTRGVLLVSGDPVGEAEAIPALLAETGSFATRHGLKVAALGASAGMLAHYRRLGFRAFYLGDEALVSTSLSLRGRAIRKVRQSVTRLERHGYQVELVATGELGEDDIVELERVSTAQLAGASERGFAMAMDTLRSDLTAGATVALARDRNGRLAGFLHFVPSYGRPVCSLAAMRRLRTSPNGLTEFLIVRSLEALRQQGIEQVSLNFAFCGRYLRAPTNQAEQLAAFALRRLGRWFQIESLHRYSAKFFPRWQPRYLAYQGALGLLPTALAALQIEGQLPNPLRSLLPGLHRRTASPQAEGVPARPHRTRAALAAAVLATLILGGWTFASPLPYPLLARTLDLDALNSVHTSSREVGLIIEAPPALAPAIASALQRNHASASFALPSAPDQRTLAGLRHAGDQPLPTFDGRASLHWVRTLHRLRLEAKTLGYPRRFYYLQPYSGFSLADYLLARRDGGQPLTAQIHLRPHHPPRHLHPHPGQLILLSLTPPTTPALATLHHLLRELTAANLQPVTIHTLLAHARAERTHTRARPNQTTITPTATG